MAKLPDSHNLFVLLDAVHGRAGWQEMMNGFLNRWGFFNVPSKRRDCPEAFVGELELLAS
ncbi:hypothetical protein D3C78_270890 [compost metagenome]